MVLGNDCQRARCQADAFADIDAVLHVLAHEVDFGARQRIGLEGDLFRNLDHADIVEHRADTERADILGRQFQFLADDHRQYRDVERMEIHFFAGNLVVHQVNRDILVGQHRIDHLSDQFAGLAQRFLRSCKQVPGDVLDRSGRALEFFFAFGNRSALLRQFFDALALGQYCRAFRLRLGGCRGGRWRRCRRCQRFDVALGRIETHARQPQPANRVDLILALDLEAAESKRMIHPAEIQVDEQADAQLVGRDVLTVICFRHSGVHQGFAFATRRYPKSSRSGAACRAFCRRRSRQPARGLGGAWTSLIASRKSSTSSKLRYTEAKRI